ncbi:MAG: seryl-tRNA synthetase [Flavobacteriales bacterium]|jgi:seryl-tRNA synthetase
MPFDPNSAKKVGKKSKRGPTKKENPSIKEKMEMLYEKVLDDLMVNQEKLTKTELVKLFVTLSNYIFPKTKICARSIYNQAVKRNIEARIYG